MQTVFCRMVKMHLPQLPGGLCELTSQVIKRSNSLGLLYFCFDILDMIDMSKDQASDGPDIRLTSISGK